MKIVVEISDEHAKEIDRAIRLANNSDANIHGVLGFEPLAGCIQWGVNGGPASIRIASGKEPL